jgi:hypothetical protein
VSAAEQLGPGRRCDFHLGSRSPVRSGAQALSCLGSRSGLASIFGFSCSSNLASDFVPPRDCFTRATPLSWFQAWTFFTAERFLLSLFIFVATVTCYCSSSCFSQRRISARGLVFFSPPVFICCLSPCVFHPPDQRSAHRRISPPCVTSFPCAVNIFPVQISAPRVLFFGLRSCTRSSVSADSICRSLEFQLCAGSGALTVFAGSFCAECVQGEIGMIFELPN